MSEKTKVKEKNSAGYKVFTVLGIVLCVILVPILIINVTMIIQGYVNPEKVPSFGGYSPLIVLSPSMEDTIMKGDLVIVKSAQPDEVEDGDIISFFDPDSTGTAVLTHRCIEVVNENGVISFKTKGDNNDSADPTPAPAENLVGKYITRIPFAGSVAMWLQTTPGLIVCVAVPIVLLVAYDLIMKKRYDKTKKKDTDDLLKELEELRALQAQQEQAPQAAAVQPQAAVPQTAPAAQPVQAPAESPAPAAQPAQAPVPQATPAPKPASVPRDLSDIDALINEIENEDK
ncbi:MAG: signal peptidase I [Ruminococcus sp.]|nr:signal peptidase I [Ruminococcus sp.]